MKTYALDTFFDTRTSKFIHGSDAPLNIVYIGDSLTAGASSYEIDEDKASARPWHWVDITATHIGKLTDRKVNIYNAGVGGTATDFVGKMISETTLPFSPDIVFIENINDIHRTPQSVGESTERLIRSLAMLDKAPVVILVHLLNNFGSRDEAHYLKQAALAQAKDDAAKKYGITSSVNYLELFYNETKFDVTHKWYLSDFGETKIAAGDVHPLNAGYTHIGNYVAEQINVRPEALFTRLVCPDDTVYPNADIEYKMTYPTSERFTYSGFKLYTKDAPNVLTGKYLTQTASFYYPFGGYAQSISADGKDFLEFTTTADTVSICYKNPPVQYMCNTVKVYVDGVFKSSGGGANPYANNYGSVDIAELDGKEHKIRLGVDVPTEERDVFNFLFLAEGVKRST